MIDREHELPVVRQCELLDLARSTAYYEPLPVPEADLALMRRIDELHLKWPFLGSRRIRGGQSIGASRCGLFREAAPGP